MRLSGDLWRGNYAPIPIFIVFLAASFLEVQRQLLHEELLEEDPNAAKPTLGDVKRRYEKTARRLFIKSVVDYVRQGLTLQNIYQRLRA